MNLPQTIITPSWQDYELLDSGNGKKLERYGDKILVRQESQALWKPSLPSSEWQNAYATFDKTSDKHGEWRKKDRIFEWPIRYKNLKCIVKLTPFGHTGVFPEQSIQWDWIQEKIRNSTKQLNVLSLFTYTGLSTLAAASAGAHVVHVDASGPAISWARENAHESKLEKKPVRWIVEDAVKFVEREVRRGNKYDAVIMDPPKFGRGPKGEVWKFEESFPKLMESVAQLLVPDPTFLLVTAYAIPISPITLANIVNDYTKKYTGNIDSGELALEEASSKRLLPTSLFARWTF